MPEATSRTIEPVNQATSAQRRLPAAVANGLAVLWCLALAVGVYAAVVALLYRVWAACDADANDAGRNLALTYLYAPAAAAVTLVSAGLICRALLRSRQLTTAVAALPVTLVAAAVVVWAVVAWRQGDALVSPQLCPAGVPTWWPRWIPL